MVNDRNIGKRQKPVHIRVIMKVKGVAKTVPGLEWSGTRRITRYPDEPLF